LHAVGDRLQCAVGIAFVSGCERAIGYAAYEHGFEFTAVLPLELDGIVFVDRTEASHLLP
jgi:hypothetical protein